MISRPLVVGFVLLVFVGACASMPAQAAIYSPTQAQLNSVAFADFWPGNGATLNSKTLVGTDGVEYSYDTGFASPFPDPFSQSQFEAPFAQNLTGLSAFGIDFQVPMGGSANGNQLEAQVYLRYSGGGGFAASNRVKIGTAGRTSVSLNLAALPPTALNHITAFGIELSSDEPFNADFGDRVRAFTSPQPPTLHDGQNISDFEGNDPGTWVSGFQPDHVQTIVTADGSTFNNGVTKGTHALQITRTYTGADFPTGSGNRDFRWGSQMTLNANLPASMGTDPVVQGKINTLVDAINAAGPNGRIAFDVSFKNVDHFPSLNPDFLGFEMSIADGHTGAGGSAFYQADFGFPPIPLIGNFYKGVTLSVPISMFQDESPNSFGNLGVAGLLLQKNPTLTFGLSTNTDGNATFVIDNIRVQTAAVPEPATLWMLLAGILTTCCRRRPKVS